MKPQHFRQSSVKIQTRAMFLKYLSFFVIALSAEQKTVQSAECTFRISVIDGYTCQLLNQTIRSEPDMENIGGIHLPSFTNEDVTGLTEGNSSILVFPSVIIDKFVNLQTVYLPSANIQFFNSPIANCQNEQINLNANKIFSIPQGIFRNCQRLVGLSFARNEIESISNNAFVGLTRLTFLSLSSNKIQRLSFNVFAPMTSMIRLYLDTNHIQEVDPRWFQSMTNLNVLNLNDNHIASWNSTILRNNVNLEVLSLARNQITSVDGNTFSNLPILSFLSIGGLMEEVPALYGMRALRTLWLSNNLITNVLAFSFRQMDNLTQLFLDDNLIETVDFTLRYENRLPRLEILSLVGNRITRLQDKAFSTLVSLNVLYLAKNRLQLLQTNSIRPTITQLHLLDIQDNRITRIERELFVNVTRVVIHAGGNICIDKNVIASDFTNHTATLLDRCFNFAPPKTVSEFVIILSLAASTIWAY